MMYLLLLTCTIDLFSTFAIVSVLNPSAKSSFSFLVSCAVQGLLTFPLFARFEYCDSSRLIFSCRKSKLSLLVSITIFPLTRIKHDFSVTLIVMGSVSSTKTTSSDIVLASNHLVTKLH